MDKELLKKAFEAGRDYQYSINPYSGKPNNDKALSFTKWYNKLVKKLPIPDSGMSSVNLKKNKQMITRENYLKALNTVQSYNKPFNRR